MIKISLIISFLFGVLSSCGAMSNRDSEISSAEIAQASLTLPLSCTAPTANISPQHFFWSANISLSSSNELLLSTRLMLRNYPVEGIFVDFPWGDEIKEVITLSQADDEFSLISNSLAVSLQKVDEVFASSGWKYLGSMTIKDIEEYYQPSYILCKTQLR